MSNRTLIEINHDFSHAIDACPAGRLENLLLQYLRSGSKKDAAALEPYGIRVFGMRHHSESFAIRWGTALRWDDTSPPVGLSGATETIKSD